MNEQREFIKKVMKFFGVDMYFLRLGMRVQYGEEFGSVVGFSGRNTLLVRFDNELRFGNKPLSVFPYYQMRYFTEKGIVIKETF